MIGQTVLHYKILEKLGEGGMGVVYRAEDTRLKRIVALKFLPPDLTRDSEAKERFVREAQAASALDHPNICTIHEVRETEDGRLFIVMAYYGGGTLQQRIAAGPLSVKDAVTFTAQTAQGLAAAHGKGIIHRDVKPGNIIITPEGIAKIVDFGLAKLVGQPGVTKTASTLGTVAYMSPELVRGEDVDHRTDLWSLGVSLYEMLAGKRPFKGEHEAAVMYEILNVSPPPLQQVRADMPDRVEFIVSQLLQKDPSARIASASVLVEELEARPVAVPSTPTDKSIAVMYFENMSSEGDTDYFCAGMTEDIITDLSKVAGLKVIPRTDVLSFRNKEVNVQKLGEMLRVNYVLEGTVRKSEKRIRITAQLTDVRSRYHIWADRFDRFLEDIFDLQFEVSGKIVEALRISLSESEKASLAKRPTDDLRAYDFYMRGKDLISRRGKKNAELAIQMLERALSIDPGFVGALASLAEAYSHLYTWYDNDQKWLAKIIELSERVLAMEPASLEARLALGTVYFHQNRYLDARRIFESLVQTNNNFYEGFLWLGIIYDLTGEYDEALRCYRRASELKPYSEEAWTRIDMTFRRKGDQQSSDDVARTEQLIADQRLALNPDDIVTRSRVAIRYARFGDRENALAEVRKIQEADAKDGHALYNAACAMSFLREKAEMLRCLRVALEGGQLFRVWVKKDPDFDAYRQDPDFQRLIQEFQ